MASMAFHASDLVTQNQGTRQYELTNHLGNVLSTITDKGVITSAQDYYPFGLTLASRSFTEGGSVYRFGFNGQEKTPELGGGHTTAEYWEYDAKLGRRWNVDPIDQISKSNYSCLGNNPIINMDPNGAKDVYYDNSGNHEKTKNNNWFHNLLFGTQRHWGSQKVSKERFWQLSEQMANRTSVNANEPTIRSYEKNWYDHLNDGLEFQSKISPIGAASNRMLIGVAQDVSLTVQGLNPLPHTETNFDRTFATAEQRQMAFVNTAGMFIGGAENLASKSVGIEGGMFRRTKNLGAFSGLEVNMNLKTVKHYANAGGVGLNGVKIKIMRDADLVGRGVFGYAHPNGKLMYLYPDAFSSPENLIRTLGHERTHLFQFKLYGANTGTADGMLNEMAAYGIEDSFIQYWKMNGKR